MKPHAFAERSQFWRRFNDLCRDPPVLVFRPEKYLLVLFLAAAGDIKGMLRLEKPEWLGKKIEIEPRPKP